MPILGIMASQISGHLWAPEGAYDSLATVTLSASATSVTFAGIPAGYKHLQIRMLARTDRANSGGGDYTIFRFNGDSGSNYAYHQLYGNGTSAAANAATSSTFGIAERVADNGATSGMFGAIIYDVLDYANVSKNKTVRALGGYDNNSTGGSVFFQSGLWMSTSAITSMQILPGGGTNFVTNSTFALYGVR